LNGKVFVVEKVVWNDEIVVTGSCFS
jgi:hypothetical protein